MKNFYASTKPARRVATWSDVLTLAGLFAVIFIAAILLTFII